MDGAVTYADVKFVKNPETAKNRHRGTEALDHGEVTYANIRVPGRDARPESADRSNGCQEYGGNGEIAYAEVKVTQTVGANVISGSSWTSSKASQLWRRALAAHASHILMVTCVLLLVTTIALGVRYSQNSLQLTETQQHLQRLGQHHETLNDSMYQRVRESDRALMDTEDRLTETQRQSNQDRDSWKQTQQQLQITKDKLREAEESLRTTKQALSDAETSLSKREDALSQSHSALNRERDARNALDERCRGTEADLNTCKSNLAGAKSRGETKETALRQAEEQLNAKKNLISTLCANKQTWIQHFSGGTGYLKYCPLEWVLIHGKCYFFSENKDTRDASEKDCKWRHAKLAVVKSQDGLLEDYIKAMSQEYWIGLKKVNYKWTWSDGSSGTAPDTTPEICAARGKKLASENCYRRLRWICEKEASKCSSQESVGQCFTN